MSDQTYQALEDRLNVGQSLAPMTTDVPAGVLQVRAFLDGLHDLPVTPFAGRIDDLTIPTRDGSVPARSYRPDLDAAAPVFVYLHGGGFVSGGLGSHDNVCRELAAGAGAVVVAVDYRLAPEHPFPAPVHDAADATAWVAANAAELGADPGRLAVAGDSAGAGLAAAVAIDARDRGGPAIALQVLVYPKIDFVGEHASHGESFGGFGITAETAEVFDRAYLPEPAMRSDPLASPLAAPDLSGLPPAVVVAAARDTLRDEAEAYAKRLHEAGVPVASLRALGQAHGFLHLSPLDAGVALFNATLWAGAGAALRGPGVDA
jgi:acetyl esterase